MAYRSREVAVRAFEAAAEIVRTLERGRPVAAFLEGYAREHNRAAKTSHPARYRELLEMITREALLAMVARTLQCLPQILSSPSKKRLRPAEANALAEQQEIFRQEFFSALPQALDWDTEEWRDFLHDLELYRLLSAGEPHRARGTKLAATVEGPFVDRVALLLDPAMLEKARRAAAKFQAQIEAGSDTILKRVFSRRRRN